MAYTIIQRVANSNSASGTTVVLTVSSTTGKLIVVAIANGTGGYTVSSVTDNIGNTYAQFTGAAAHGNDDSFTGKHTDVWRCLNATAGVTTITVTISSSGTQERFAVMWEVGGTTTPVDDVGAVANDQNYAADPCLGASATTTGAGVGFAVGVVSAQFGISANPTSGNEFSSGGNISTGTNQAAVSLLNPTSAAHRPSWDGTIGHGCASTASFKESVAATPDLTWLPVNRTMRGQNIRVVASGFSPGPRVD